MGIGTPKDLGHNASSTSPTSLAITTGNSVSAGDLIIVVHYANSIPSGYLTSITDSAGNTYTQNVGQHAALSTGVEIWSCVNALSMASSSTITTNMNSGSRHGVTAFAVSGMVTSGGPGVIDVNATTATTTGTSTSATTQNIAPTAATTSLILGVLSAGATITSPVPGGSWTQVGGTITTATVVPCYQIVSALTPVAFAPSWTNSVLYRSSGFSFIGIPANSINRQSNLGLCGVGA
jgi:hypothetical protein